MSDDEMTDKMAGLFPLHISDESAAVLCDFLAGLSLAAESRYFCKVRRYREESRAAVDPDHPWESHKN